MAEQSSGGRKEGFWAIVSAIGGVIGGAASVLGVFAAKPDLITVVVPVQTLREVVVAAELRENPQTAQPGAASGAAVQQTPSAPVVVAPLAADAPRPLGGNLSVAVVSLAETPALFSATLRFTNDSDAEQLIAVRATGIHSGDFNLTDGFGGSCPWRWANIADSLGTLQPAGATAQPAGSFEARFSPVPPHGSVVHTLLFNKRSCVTPASGEHPMSLSGTFVVVEGDAWRTAAASFEGITAVRSN